MKQNQSHIVTRTKVWTTFGAIVVVAVFAFLYAFPRTPKFVPFYDYFSKRSPKLGLDLQGGTRLLYQADLSSIKSGDNKSAMDGVRDVIERRVNAFGVSEPVVQVAGGDRLIVELAGVKDVSQAIKQIGETPLLEFKEEAGAPPTITPKVQSFSDQELKDIKKYNQDQEIKARGVLKRLQAGEDFTMLAKEFSEDPGSKEKGGEIGFVKKGALVPEYENIIFNKTKDGQLYYQPVKSSFGFHLIKRTAHKGEGDNLEVNSQHILFKTKSEVPTADLNLADAQQQANWQNTELSGKQLKSSRVEFDQRSGLPHVSLEFNDDGAKLFATITKKNVGKKVAIFLDGQPISIPMVQEEITGGRAVISGNFSLAEAKTLAQRLNAGALPVPINLISQQTVGATLGAVSLEKSLIAGLIGFLLIVLFMISFYRLPGLIASIALLLYVGVSLSVFELFGVTLTVAGIAGFILSLGMAVDANVLIFERTRDEMSTGKSLANSIEDGFVRAWLSIRDSNVSSLITCAVLAWLGTSFVKGFAITLALGIIISLFSAITVTRTFLRLVASNYFNNHRGWFGGGWGHKHLTNNQQ
jgi:protein-export membrane protein SecD